MQAVAFLTKRSASADLFQISRYNLTSLSEQVHRFTDFAEATYAFSLQLLKQLHLLYLLQADTASQFLA